MFLGRPPRFTNVIRNIVLQSLCQERVIRQQACLISSNYLPTKWLHSQNAPATTGKTDGIFCEGVVIFQRHLYLTNPLLQIWDHKFLGNREICHMFTKNNTIGSKMNGCEWFFRPNVQWLGHAIGSEIEKFSEKTSGSRRAETTPQVSTKCASCV